MFSIFLLATTIQPVYDKDVIKKVMITINTLPVEGEQRYNTFVNTLRQLLEIPFNEEVAITLNFAFTYATTEQECDAVLITIGKIFEQNTINQASLGLIKRLFLPNNPIFSKTKLFAGIYSFLPLLVKDKSLDDSYVKQLFEFMEHNATNALQRDALKAQIMEKVGCCREICSNRNSAAYELLCK